MHRMERVRTAVAVCAHPDDLEYFCGGTIRAMADDGWHIGLVIATDGSGHARSGRQQPAGGIRAAGGGYGRRLDTRRVARGIPRP